MRHLLPLLPLLLAPSLGCGPPNELEREDFPARTAGIFCERLRECARGEFDRDYFGMADCVEHLEREFALIDEAFAELDCDYDSEGAARAMDHLATMTCEEFFEEEYLEDYDKVWDCE